MVDMKANVKLHSGIVSVDTHLSCSSPLEGAIIHFNIFGMLGPDLTYQNVLLLVFLAGLLVEECATLFPTDSESCYLKGIKVIYLVKYR